MEFGTIWYLSLYTAGRCSIWIGLGSAIPIVSGMRGWGCEGSSRGAVRRSTRGHIDVILSVSQNIEDSHKVML